MLGGRRLLVRIPIVVTRGARLILHSRHVRQLLLRSSPFSFASIMDLGGMIRLTGTARQPLEVASFQPDVASPDNTIDDGRPFVLDRSGWMNLRYVRAESLGFGEAPALALRGSGRKRGRRTAWSLIRPSRTTASGHTRSVLAT